MSTYLLDGVEVEIDKEIIREVVRDNIPIKWQDEGIEDIVDEIAFRIESLEFENIDFVPEERYSIACVDYILCEGDDDPIGIDLLINEMDDTRIWDYL